MSMNLARIKEKGAIMEALTFLTGLFDKLIIFVSILHFAAIYFACKFHRLIFNKKNSVLWFFSTIFPFLIPLAAYYTGSQAQNVFSKKQIQNKADFGIIHASMNVVSNLLLIGGAVYFFGAGDVDMDDFNIFSMLLISSLFCFALSSGLCVYTYFSLSKSVIEWRAQRKAAKKAPSAA